MSISITRRTAGILAAVAVSLGPHLPVCAQTRENAEENAAVPDKRDASADEILSSLEASFSKIKTVQAAFTQEKKLAILSRKIELKGKIVLENPDRLAWHVSKPVRYSFVILGTVMRQWDEDADEVQEISLKRNPVFKVVSEEIKSWFAGKYGSLRKQYDIQVLKDKPTVVLAFVPKADSEAKKILTRVTIEFLEDRRYIKQLSIEECNGDKTSFTFTDVILNEPVDTRTWELPASD